MKHYCNINARSNADTLTKKQRLDFKERCYNENGYKDLGFHVEQEDDGPLRLVHVIDDGFYSEAVEINFCPKCGYSNKDDEDDINIAEEIKKNSGINMGKSKSTKRPRS